MKQTSKFIQAELTVPWSIWYYESLFQSRSRY